MNEDEITEWIEIIRNRDMVDMLNTENKTKFTYLEGRMSAFGDLLLKIYKSKIVKLT